MTFAPFAYLMLKLVPSLPALTVHAPDGWKHEPIAAPSFAAQPLANAFVTASHDLDVPSLLVKTSFSTSHRPMSAQRASPGVGGTLVSALPQHAQRNE